MSEHLERIREVVSAYSERRIGQGDTALEILIALDEFCLDNDLWLEDLIIASGRFDRTLRRVEEATTNLIDPKPELPWDNPNHDVMADLRDVLLP